MKNILLLVHDDHGQEARLQAALDITRAVEGHLTCIDVTPYPLIAGDGFGSELFHGQSDALLGIFDAIAPAASAALGELAQGNTEKFHAILGPTVPLSRHIFAAPTRFYKTGVVFMAWLNGHQRHFTMVGGQQSTRSLVHFAELFRLADQANLLEQPDLAVARMKNLLALHGVET